MADSTGARNLIEIFLMTCGAIFIAVLITPNFNTINLSEIWSSFRSWLRPPFIYLIVNGIIISIVASSCFHRHNHQPQVEDHCHKRVIPRKESGFRYHDAVLERDETTPFGSEGGGNDEFVPDETTPFETTRIDKPSSKTIRAAPKVMEKHVIGEKDNRDDEERHHETMESIWKRITENRKAPRNLRKSDTWKAQIASSEPSTPSLAKKSETFRERRNGETLNRKMKREKVLSQDELNRRVEEFIGRFNKDMRMQCQGSMINPAA